MLNAGEKNILSNVEKFGWHVMCIGPAADSDDLQEWFAYTVGLSKTFGWPELICFGLDLRIMANLLNDAVEECRSRGVEPHNGLVLNNVIASLPARLATPFEMADTYVNSACWLARREGLALSVLQLLWPDEDGHFPDEPNCAQGVVEMQTPLEVD